MIRRFFVGLALLSFLGSSPLFAQQENWKSTHASDILRHINHTYEEGILSLDQKVLYQLYAVHSPHRLPEKLRSRLSGPLKCGTPAAIDYQHYRPQLQPSTMAEGEPHHQRSTAHMQAEATYLSPSGKFQINYTTSGEDSVSVTDTSGVDGVPDYVEWVAAAADSSWRHQVQNLGYTDPVVFPSDPYEVYIRNLNAYGETRSSSGTTYIVIHNSFEGFPPNTDPEGNVQGSIKVTMAHELKHAIQYAATGWRGESDQWAEMDATLMEEVVYDNVNDYYNYIRSRSLSPIFLFPEKSFYPGSYEHVTWALFFEEKYGSDFWVNVWKRLKTDPQAIRLTEAMREVLDRKNTFRSNYVESQLWHYASGAARAPSDYGFEERRNYPDPSIYTTFTGVDSLATPVTIRPLAANYVELNPISSIPGFIRITLDRSAPDIGMGLIAYFTDGSTERIVLGEGDALVLTEQTNWEWSEIQRMGIIVANSSETASQTYKIKVITNIPDATTLSQNYPNPFSPVTTIPFTLNQESGVQLKVYDILGRLVQTLLDDTLPAGFYAPRFQAHELASGVYIYQLITDEKVLTKKMVLVK